MWDAMRAPDSAAEGRAIYSRRSQPSSVAIAAKRPTPVIRWSGECTADAGDGGDVTLRRLR